VVLNKSKGNAEKQDTCGSSIEKERPREEQRWIKKILFAAIRAA
jgi:hypothetical protein